MARAREDPAAVPQPGSHARASRRDVIVLFLASLLVRVAALFLVQTHNVIMSGDENRYWNRAVAFSDAWDTLGSGGELAEKQRDAMYDGGSWPPLHSLLMAVGLQVFGPSLGVARAQQVLMSALTTVLVYLLALRMATRRAALFAGLFHALYPDFIGFSVNLWSETSYILLLVLAVLVWARLSRRERARPALGTAVLGGVLLAALLLTRPAALPYLFVVPAWLFFAAKRRIRRPWLVPAVLAATALAFVAPWEVVASRAEGRFVPLSSFAGTNLAIGNNPHVPEGFDSSWGHLESMVMLGRAINQESAENDDEDLDVSARRIALRTIRADSGAFLARTWRRSLSLWTPDFFLLRSALRLELPGLPAWFVASLWIGIPVAYAFFLATAFLGVLVGWSELRHAGLVLALVAAGMLPPLVAFGFSRLHLPLLVLLLPLSGYGTSRLGTKLGFGRGFLFVAFAAGLVASSAVSMRRVLERHLFPSIHYRGLVAVADRALGTTTYCGDRIKLRTSEKWAGQTLELELVTDGYVLDDQALRRPSADRVRRQRIASGSERAFDVDVRILDERADPLVLRIRRLGSDDVVELAPLELANLRTWRPAGLPELELQWVGGL